MKHSYVKLNGIELRLGGNEYWRAAGAWSVEFIEKDGKLFSVSLNHPQLHNVELIPITKKEWQKGNEGYI